MSEDESGKRYDGVCLPDSQSRYAIPDFDAGLWLVKVWGETGALVDPDPRVLALVLYGPTPGVSPALGGKLGNW